MAAGNEALKKIQEVGRAHTHSHRHTRTVLTPGTGLGGVCVCVSVPFALSCDQEMTLEDAQKIMDDTAEAYEYQQVCCRSRMLTACLLSPNCREASHHRRRRCCCCCVFGVAVCVWRRCMFAGAWASAGFQSHHRGRRSGTGRARGA